MPSFITGHIMRFIVCMALQILLVSQFTIFGYAFGFIYVVFLLKLPVSISKPVLLFFAFTTGFIIDIFSHSWGLHAASCVLMMFVRPVILTLLMPQGGYEDDMKIEIEYMGSSWFIRYSVLMILVHHSSLFFLEIFSLHQLGFTLIRIILSSIFSLFLILILQYIFSKSVHKTI